MKRRPVVLGCDPGESNTAFGVMGDGEILHSSLLIREEMPWNQFCVTFQDTMTSLIACYTVEIIAIEDFIWEGRYADVEPPIRELIGITRTFSRSLRVLVIPSFEWSRAITGTRPAKLVKGNRFDQSRSWKKTVRAALTQQFELIGINLDAAVGPDHGSHRTDALALSLYAQDYAHVHAHQRREYGHASTSSSTTEAP